MSDGKTTESRTTARRGGFRLSANLTVAIICLSAVGGMVGASYASVPLYRLFCQVTGYGGTTRTAVNSEGIKVIDRDITVRFDANVSPSLNLKFEPVQRSVTIKLGEVKKIAYTAENTTDKTIYGTATFNVTPQQVGAYFNKLECFCFTETVVKPGEKLDMPVVFFVDPELVDGEETRNVHTVTLSYTFYPTPEGGKPVETTRSNVVKDGSTGG
ncbi:MAG: cytochrome c oxidase assembly protein [Hyphomicrobiaceae bacterium]|nr:cytochrome c oxidase assembly protein [Hyphomicrobiaceae bacterium]